MDQLPDRHKTIFFWQSRYPTGLSSEAARQIAANTVGFFTTLQRWQDQLSNAQPALDSKQEAA